MDDSNSSPSHKRQKIDAIPSSASTKRPLFSDSDNTIELPWSDLCGAVTESDDELPLPFKLPSSTMAVDRVYCNLCATQTPRDSVYRCKICDLFLCSDKCCDAHLTHFPDHHVVSPKQQQVKSLADRLVDAFMGSILPVSQISPISPVSSSPVRAPSPPPPPPVPAPAPAPAPVIPAPSCPYHKIECTMFDATVNTFVCSKCRPAHSHDIVELPASAQQQRADGILRLESLVKRLHERVDEAQQHSASLQTQEKQISQSIHAGFARLRDLLTTREQELVQQLKSACLTANREATYVRTSSSRVVNDVQKFIGFLRDEKSFEGPDGSTLPRMRMLRLAEKLIAALGKSFNSEFSSINAEMHFEKLEKSLGEPAGRIGTDATD